ncbi:MAG: peroxiredoxin family protein [Chloroflexaceae bacterium]|jgi:peroxiredoxin|nr:peroxiredoxin family protein [Chloroflexaceae bacterium]
MEQQTEPLRRGSVIPNFTLNGLDGRPMRRSELRGRQHLALLFFPSLDGAILAYLRDVANSNERIVAAGGTVWVVVAAAPETAPELPFPILLDQDCNVTRQFLSAGASSGVFLTDRYGELYFQSSGSLAALPPAEDIAAWIEAIDQQCAI